jgi:hypothetical protein
MVGLEKSDGGSKGVTVSEWFWGSGGDPLERVEKLLLDNGGLSCIESLINVWDVPAYQPMVCAVTSADAGYASVSLWPTSRCSGLAVHSSLLGGCL